MRTKIFLSVVVSFVLGAVVMWCVMRQRTMNVFGQQYLVGVMDQANVALHIRGSKQGELLKTIDASLPEYVSVVDQVFRGHDGSTNALWMVKAYYERNGIAIPSEIKGILDSLPPKPPGVCRLRLEALDRILTTNTTDTGVQK
jgi:hypothetical protein